MSIKAIILFSAISVSQASLASSFDDAVLRDRPVLYLTLGSTARVPFEPDLSGGGHRGNRFLPGGAQWTQMPNGDKATVFDGATRYLEVRSHPALSVATTGVLTIAAWIRPDTLEFPHQEGSGYVHWAGKGEANAQEYVLRMYSRTNAESRPNRISGYAFNLDGNFGSGSYFQEPVVVGQWIHVAVVINTVVTTPEYPTGYVRIFRNGVLRKTTALNQFDVTPEAGTAPLRIGTRDKDSFFKGAIGKFTIYNYELSAAKLLTQIRIMTPSPL